jgi:hypothetical protein
LTPPIDRGAEIRCHLRDPDGYPIEVGQATADSSERTLAPGLWRLVALENGLSVLATLRQDDSIQTSVINAGVLNTHLRVCQWPDSPLPAAATPRWKIFRAPDRPVRCSHADEC